jgi:hypothetical protein
MTQRDRVLDLLKRKPQCATDFFARYIPRIGARIYDLRREGITIETRRCQQHKHRTRQVEYVLKNGGTQ